MILTTHEIREAVKAKDILIMPWDDKCLGPNSYNLRLSRKLLVYEDARLRVDQPNRTREIDIGGGHWLYPNELYLGQTVEHTSTYKYIPMIEGRSSFARLGISVHASAGFGDVGFTGYWTLEITTVKPVWIVPEIEICQIFFVRCNHEKAIPYKGKYQNNDGVQPSMLYKDFTTVRDSPS